MPGLFWAKRRTARHLGSRSLEADARQTMACMVLSITLLIGSGVNYWTGIPQADSVAALFIGAFLLKEGCEALTTKSACAC
jgi:divalent metal cation (Fe/Co/Zn/Cd) transporter